MSTVFNKMTRIADAVRTKTGGTAKLGFDDMISALDNISLRTSSNLTSSGAAVSAPAGIYLANATKTIATVAQATPGKPAVNSSGLISVSSVQSAGYLASPTTTTNTLSLTALGATTYTPSTADQTIASGKYLIGTQTIKGDANLVPSNIKSGVSIFGVTGTNMGVGLKLSVVASETEPTSPSPNMIWIQSSTPVRGYVLGELRSNFSEVPISIDSDGSTYGYQKGYYISSSGGGLTARTASYVTGFIPCGVGNTVHLKNLNFDSDSSDTTYNRVAFYDAEFNYLGFFNSASTAVPANSVQDENGVWTEFTTKATMSGQDCSTMAYMRLCCSDINDSSIITITSEGEIISEGTVIIPCINEENAASVNCSSSSNQEFYISPNEAWQCINGEWTIVNAYIYKGEYTNVLDTVGYTENARFSTSSTSIVTATGWDITGYIPAKPGDIIRMRNMQFYDIEGGGGTIRNNVWAFKEGKVYSTCGAGAWSVSNPMPDTWNPVHGDNGDVIQFTLPTSWNDYNVLWLICGRDINENSIITVNEELGEWVQFSSAWDGYYFKNGDQYEYVTGGWTSEDWTYYNYPMSSSNIFETYMQVNGSYTTSTGTGTMKVSVVGTINTIPLDDVSKIYAKINITQQGSVYLGITDSKNAGTSGNLITHSAYTNGEHTLEINVSQLTGNYYIVIFAGGSTNYGRNPTAQITEVWGE